MTEWRLRDRKRQESLDALATEEPFFYQALNRRFADERPDAKKFYTIRFGYGDDVRSGIRMIIAGSQIVEEKGFDPQGWNDLSEVVPRPDTSIVYQLEVERDGKVECFAARWNQHTEGWRTASQDHLISVFGADSVRYREWRRD